MHRDNFVEPANKAEAGLARTMNRRTVVKGAAWAVPVIAAAVAVPAAAASTASPADSAVISAATGGTINANGTAGTATGTLEGAVNINGVQQGPWETGALFGEYLGSGPWSSVDIVDGEGNDFIQGAVIFSGGVNWTVNLVEADAGGTWRIVFFAPSQSVSTNTSFFLPPAKFSGTFVPGVPVPRTPVGASVRVAADAVNSGNTVTAAVQFP